jgi:thioredoxin reductase/NAD-dependent dihydropyrimidine dehydrogenase PreA subunit
MLEEAIYTATAAAAIGIPVLYIYLERRKARRARERWRSAEERGLTEPVTLHPVIDPARCIGTSACVPACPEGEILGVIDGRAKLVSPSKCIGHGACEASCPVGAITLVFGTERRGVDIPFVKETFETNVEGIYIAGELGGMGLIRNAVTQGRQAMDYIGRSLNGSQPGVHDVAIVGAGPAGLSASLQARSVGLDCVTLDQDDVGGTILSYPRQKLVMTQPMEVPLYGTVKAREIVKEDLLGLWKEIIEKTGLEVRTNERVETITRNNGYFRIGSVTGEHLAQRVLLAIGRRGTPRKLGVPGEMSSKVAYRLLEPEQYLGQDALVVGGGDSAVEAALALSAQPGCRVTLSYRKQAFGRIKEKNGELIDEAIKLGRVKMLFESAVTEIRPDEVLLEQDGKRFTVANDYVFIFIGGVLPTNFLQGMGISIEKKFGTR